MNCSWRWMGIAALWLGLSNTAMAGNIALKYLGQMGIPTGTTVLSTTLGGLSGIDYDPSSNTYYAISDDRSQNGPARFYNLSLNYDRTGFHGVNFNSVQTMKRFSSEGGGTFPTLQVDPEAIRFDPATNTLLWTSEGERQGSTLLNPFVREMDLSGNALREFTVPSKFFPTTSGATGIRRNLAFESLTLSSDGQTVYTANENSLFQDGAISSLSVSGKARILSFNKPTGAPGAEYVYAIDRIPQAPVGGTAADNGLVELLATGPGTFLAMERAFAQGVGNNIRIYEISLAGATDVSGIAALTGAETPVSKTLLLDLGTLGIPQDNIEGLTFGHRLDNGNRSLVLVSDNNFSTTQFNQFVAFEIVPEPSTIMLSILGMLSLPWLRRSRDIRK